MRKPSKLLSLLLALAMIIAIVPVSNITVSAASYTNDWQRWSQGASDDSNIRAYGCWVVAQARLIKMLGINNSSTFNPDVYLKWEQSAGHINSNYYQINGDTAPVDYAKSLGKNLTYCGTYYSSSDVWKCINNGDYGIICVSTSDSPTGSHWILLDNDRSKSTGVICCYDSWSGYSVSRSVTLSEMSYTFYSIYTYRYNPHTHTNSSSTVVQYSATFELMSDSKIEHMFPYGDTDITKKYTKGDLINVVGYVYNDYGNLWYKTSTGGFIYYEYLKLYKMVNFLPPSNYVEATMKIKTPEGSGKWVKSQPYAGGDYLKKHERNECIQITHYLYNSNGNLWYETSDGDEHYVFYSYLEVQSSDEWIPSNYVEGNIEVEISDIPVRNVIQTSGSTVVERLDKGDKKNIVGYVYNRYGNLWYVLGEDRVVYYTYCKNVGNSWLPGNFVGQDFVVCKDTFLYDGNYWGTISDDSVSKGTNVYVVAYVTNHYGNKYYEIEGGKYIPEDCLFPNNCTPVEVSDTDTQVTVNSVKAKPGDEVKVIVSLKNAPNITSMTASDIVYDKDALTLKSAEWLSANPAMNSWNPNTQKGVIGYGNAIDLNGETLELTFIVSDTAAEGDYNIGLTYRMTIDGEIVDVPVIPGTITVKNYVSGDTNGDDRVTDQDAIYLLFHVYFEDEYPVNQPCDFNKDGNVTDQDAIYLLFHVYFEEEYPIG